MLFACSAIFWKALLKIRFHRREVLYTCSCADMPIFNYNFDSFLGVSTVFLSLVYPPRPVFFWHAECTLHVALPVGCAVFQFIKRQWRHRRCGVLHMFQADFLYVYLNCIYILAMVPSSLATAQQHIQHPAQQVSCYGGHFAFLVNICHSLAS